jgi:hypothetical protein
VRIVLRPGDEGKGRKKNREKERVPTHDQAPFGRAWRGS